MKKFFTFAIIALVIMLLFVLFSQNDPADPIYIESNPQPTASQPVVLRGTQYGKEGAATGTVRATTGEPK